jgi:hypothetical protein
VSDTIKLYQASYLENPIDSYQMSIIYSYLML